MALRSARARSVQITIRASPLLDLARELLARYAATGLDVLHALADLVEDVEPVDDLIERHVVGQLLDGLDGVLLGGVCVHGALRFTDAELQRPCWASTVSSICMTKRCCERGSSRMRSIC